MNAPHLKYPLPFGGRGRGFILLPVVFAITLVAAIALLLARGGPMAMQQATGDSRAALALRVAQAGMEHALWRANRGACAGYALGSTPFGAHLYSASYSANSGSPVDITVTASLADGSGRSLIRRNVDIHQAAVSVSLNEKEDANLSENKPTQNDSNSSLLFIRSDKPGSNDRGLLRFDLGGIPMGARVLSASLSLYMYYGSGKAVPIAARRLTQDWIASQVTWNVRQTGVNWGQAGGDMDKASVSTTIVGPTQYVRYNWDLTEMVTGWVAGSYPNQGLELAGADARADEAFTTMRAGDPSLQPKLHITYACPCGMVCTAPKGSGKVLLVVGNTGSLDSGDQYRRDLFTAWGYTVTLIDDGDTQANFNTALAANAVAYVSETVTSSTLGTKLQATANGVVYEKGEQNSVLGMATGFGQAMGNSINIIDNGHPITQGFASGALRLYQANMEGLTATGSLATGARVLGRWGAAAGLAVLDKGAALASVGTAAGRRVMLPFGRNSKFNPAYLNNNGRLLVQRALAWAGETVADPLAQGLVAHWKLDDGGGTQAVDSVGGHHGTLTNGPTWTTGKLNGGLLFDGSNDLVLVPDAPTLDITDAITLAAWIKPGAVGTEYVVRKTLYGNDDGYELSLSTTGQVFFRLNQRSNGDTYRIDSTTPYPSNGSTWMHVAATYDGVRMRLYINGVQEADMAASIQIGSNSRALSIGAQTDGSRGMPGTIDDVRLYDRALSASEIAQLAAPPGGGGGGTVTCEGTFRDEFKTRSYSGSDGTLAWATDWQEVGESDGATSGDEQVLTDKGDYSLRVQDNDNGGEGVMRSADLSGYTNATLTFEYRRNAMSSSSDYVNVEVSTNGSNWTEIARIKGPTGDGGELPDSNYTQAIHDISAHVSANTRLRFLGSSSLGGSEAVLFDNVQIAVSGCAP